VTVEVTRRGQEIGQGLHRFLPAGTKKGVFAQAIGFALHEKRVVGITAHAMIKTRGRITSCPPSADPAADTAGIFEELATFMVRMRKGHRRVAMDGPARRYKRGPGCDTAVRVHTIPLLPEDLFQDLGPDSFEQPFPLGARDGMNSFGDKCESEISSLSMLK